MKISQLSYGILAIVLLIAIAHSAKQGLANAWHFNSLFYLDSWSKGQRQNAETYKTALNAAEKAWQGDSANPHYGLMLAKTLEWGHLKLWDESVDLMFIHQLYEDAIIKRSAWSDAYANYAYVKAYIFNEPLAAYELLKLAHQHGPFMPTQLQHSVYILSDFWDFLPAEAKQFYFARMTDVARSHGTTYNQAMRHIRNHRLQTVTCAYLKVTLRSDSDQQRLARGLCR